MTGPDGAVQATVALSGARVTVGRQAVQNDIVLGPDPELLVTRVAHCTLEPEGSHWYVVDGGSVNGTFVRRAGSLRQVVERTPLRDGDAVCILASTEGGERRWFELAFRTLEDSQATRRAAVRPPACLSYDAGEARLVLVVGAQRHEIPMRAQAHRLVGYMAERNAATAGAATLCTHDELIDAVWAGEPLHSRMELAKLVWELRKKLDPYGSSDLIESERGLGYRLRTCAPEG